MVASPSVRPYRAAAALAGTAALLGFFTALAFELIAPLAPATAIAFRVGLFLLVLSFLVIPLCLYRVVQVRGWSSEEKRQTIRRAVWGGPLGAFVAPWDLTESRSAGRRV